MQNMNQERQLASSGELQNGQNFGKGRIVAADYMMTPSIQGSDNNAGGVGGGGRLPGRRRHHRRRQKKEAQTSITVASVRTGVQVAAAEGAATKRDFAIGGIGLGVGAGGYTSTSEGKMVAASLLDNFNNVIQSLKTNPNVRPMTADRLAARITSGEPEAGGNFEKGAMVEVKMNGTKLLSSSNATSVALATTRAGETMMYMGERQGDFLRVQRGSAQGWVEQVLVTQSSAKVASSGGATAGGVMNEGDAMAPKIDGVKVLRTASDAAHRRRDTQARRRRRLPRRKNGTLIKVQASGGEGWVKKALMASKQ